MAIVLDSPRRSVPKPRRKISNKLICETMDGEPIYRKGYRDVLSGKKQLTKSWWPVRYSQL